MRVLGINALFHDPSVALVVDGRIVAAAEEERFSRRKHGKRPVPFAAWELPSAAMAWCLERAGLSAGDLDVVAYSYDPALATPADQLGLDDPWDWLRQQYAEQAPRFIAAELGELPHGAFRFVPHHIAHAASAGLVEASQDSDGRTSVLVIDGRGESASHLAGEYDHGKLNILAAQRLPDSLGLLYESLTEHLGFLRSSDEYKVMALASYGRPRHLAELRDVAHATGGGGFTARVPDWSQWAPRRGPQDAWNEAHADLAASLQACLEETLLDLASWLHDQTGTTNLAMAGGTALNCVANSRLWRDSPFESVWVQPAAGDAGTALGAALAASENVTQAGGTAFPTAALGREWSDADLAGELHRARVPFRTPDDLPAVVAQVLADDGIVAWFDGRSEFGPRALGQRSLLAHPGNADNLRRLNDVKGREQFRPVAPMVRGERAAEIFAGGPLPSPYMLFVHDVKPEWRERIPAVTHVDGTARAQTVDRATNPRLAGMLERFEQLTGVPVVINTSLNTAGRPMVDTPREALEIFGSAPIDLLVLGPHVVRRGALYGGDR
ncbi:MAG TPA: carbamoyltransferase C-terminal domain-containing protein [Flexivirga sp.]|uniref:carbamoyltransferase family protein n=1 Tax=Flexivirga sp. TaxID=1962927 RepID=UPI002C307B6A|nr:carbamoyltransferase C-terminal domain-containing protein [Flexivirga sp.]HWC21756.1 carbamoyltransferase C-terminal domain-containing protein [Flexivirga sp.]